MNIGQSILEALESLSANRLRSGLTILGIIIGVGAVIAMLSVGQGAQASITGAISGIGTNLLFVFSGNDTNDVRNPRPLTWGMPRLCWIRSRLPMWRLCLPAYKGERDHRSFRETLFSFIIGATPTYFSLQNYTVTEGNVITEENLVAVFHLPGLRGALRDRGDQLLDIETGLLREMQPLRQTLDQPRDADLVDHLGELAGARRRPSDCRRAHKPRSPVSARANGSASPPHITVSTPFSAPA